MPVVYNGVPGTGEGDLFQGLKLWVAQRVPQRTRWIDLVKGNGGEIVRLEKNADMLIADNVKVAGISPPIGSYMWRWIDDSVKNGFLQDKDDYLIGRREGSSRGPVLSRPTKVGRTPFTPKDDLILTKCIIAEERMGGSLSGNIIYQALERRHPHHTWQSWRDRWVKGLRNNPRPSLSEEEIQAEIDLHRGVSPQPTPGPARAARQPRLSQGPALPTQQSSTQHNPATPPGRTPSRTAPPRSGHLGPRVKRPFTEEDDQLLLEFIESERHKNRAKGWEDNTNLRGNAIYQEFADKHPTHSWHSWRDRWVRHLSLREAVDDAGPDEASNADPGEGSPLNEQRLQQPLVTGDAGTPATDGAPNAAQRPSSAKQQLNPKSDDQRLKRQLRERREARAALLIEKNWRGHAVRRDMARLEAAVVPLQSAMRGFVARMRMTSQAEARKADQKSKQADTTMDDECYEQATDEIRGEDESSIGMPHNDPGPREQFYNDFKLVSEIVGAEIDSQPTINGQRIDLWDLYRLALQQNCELEARDWKLITERLGFETVKGVVYNVQACYLKNLAEFEEYMKTFESNDSMDEEAVEEEEEEGQEGEELGCDIAANSLQPTSGFATAPKEIVAEPSSPAYRSSPPIARSKRSLQQTDLLRSDSGYPSSGPRKRRRVDRNSVIPPTPDEKLGVPNVTVHGPSMQDKSSPLKLKALDNGDAIEISSDDDSGDSVGGVMSSIEEDELPARSSLPKQKFIEPETQDWRVSQDPFTLDVDSDPSPSQQLLMESDAFKSPQRVVPSTRSQMATTHPSRPAAEISGKLSSTRELRSNPGRAAKSVNLTSALGVSANGQAKKRTLPASYQRKAASDLPANSTPAVFTEQSSRQPPVHPKGTITARPMGTTPTRAMNGSTSRPSQISAYTPTPAMRTSTNVSSGAPRLTTNEDAIASEDSEKWEEAHVVAQLRHFEALGYNPKHICQAMEAGTMSRGPMVVALESLHNGRGIPDHVPGVWTAGDCKSLLMIKKYEHQVGKGKSIADRTDGNMRIRAWNLEKKHGKEGMEDRWKFMRLSGKTEGI